MRTIIEKKIYDEPRLSILPNVKLKTSICDVSTDKNGRGWQGSKQRYSDEEWQEDLENNSNRANDYGTIW